MRALRSKGFSLLELLLVLMVLGIVAVAALMTGCDSQVKPGAVPTIDKVLSGLSTLDGSTVATLVGGEPPAAVGGPNSMS